MMLGYEKNRSKKECSAFQSFFRRYRLRKLADSTFLYETPESCKIVGKGLWTC